jgi:insulysin
MPIRLPVRITALFMLLLLATGLAAQDFRKSPNDSNQYRYLTLDNGLKVLLVHAPGSDKAAASMNVAVGSGNDPADREGLAHFLEHMLFLGTEKYPEPGEYQQFIRSHGGSHNAFTAFRDTNYFFDIQAEHLDGAMDRFAQQFSAPLFTPELVDRERNAVHSEFSAKQKEDGRRFYSIKKAAANPEHPFHQFAVGNLTTLENTDERPLRPDLIRFWKEHYSSDLMNLAVYGPQSLDKLEAMVRDRFSRIEDRNLQPEPFNAPIYAPESLPSKVTGKALKDLRTLTLSFPIPSQEAHYRSKPAHYVGNLLGHEGPGSLFQILKDQGLVESLSAGSGMDTGSHALFEINMALTPEGLDRQDEIVQLAFDYIDRVRNDGISRERFEEMQRLAQIDFRFREQGQPQHEVMRLSSLLQHIPAEDVLSAPWLMQEYAPDQYRAILDRLTPENVMVFSYASAAAPQDPQQTRWYQAEWARNDLSITGDTSHPLAEQLALPGPNPFIPEELALVDGSTMEQPVSLGNHGGIELWFARDTRFNTPKANIFLSLRTPAVRASARSKVLTDLLLDAIRTNINAWGYPAQLAGLDYSVYSHLRGITLRTGGYSDKLATLLRRILVQVKQPVLTEQRFRIARAQLIDNLENKARNRPVQQTAEFIQSLLIEGTFETEDKLAAARSVTFDELKSFAEAFLAEVDPVLLAHGNVTQASALNIANQVGSLLLKNSDIVTVPRSGLRRLPEGETPVTLTIDHPDTGYTLYMQGSDTSYPQRARYRLLGQVISSHFYEEIRTNRQLGYIVYATPFEMLETPALGFVVQSPSASAEQIDQAVRAFSEGFTDRLEGMSASDLQREKQAVISQILEQDRQLGDISQRYWSEIDRGNEDFDSRQQMVDAVRNVTAGELMETFRNAVLERIRALKVVSGEEDTSDRPAIERIRNAPKVD